MLILKKVFNSNEYFQKFPASYHRTFITFWYVDCTDLGNILKYMQAGQLFQIENKGILLTFAYDYFLVYEALGYVVSATSSSLYVLFKIT